MSNITKLAKEIDAIIESNRDDEDKNSLEHKLSACKAVCMTSILQLHLNHHMIFKAQINDFIENNCGVNL